MLLSLLLACLDAFPTDRHDLVDLRIVGVGLTPSGELRAFSWEGIDAWSAVAPSRTWEILEVTCEGDTCGALPGGTFGLKLTGADGAKETAELVVADDAAVPALLGSTSTFGEAGASLALDVPDAAMVHWMAPVGEIVETDLAAIEYTAPVDEAGAPKVGVWPVVALWMDGLGGNNWATFDVPIGVSGPFLTVGGRLFPVDTELPSGSIAVLTTLTAADDLTGFSLTDLVVDDGMAARDTPCGSVLGATSMAGDWDPDSVIERVCGLDEVVGARVRIVGEIVR